MHHHTSLQGKSPSDRCSRGLGHSETYRTGVGAMKWFSQKQVWLGLLIGALLIGGLTRPVLAGGKPQCPKINTTMTTVADFNNFTTAGEIKSGLLKGTTKFTGDPASLTRITSAANPPVRPD